MKKILFGLIGGTLLLAGCAQTTTSETNSNTTTTNTVSIAETPENAIDQVQFQLVAPSHDDMSGDLSRYLIPVEKNLETPVYTTEDEIKQALTALFAVKTFTYGESGLENSVYASTLAAATVTTASGKTTVALEGQVIGTGAVADAFLKLQITETIEQYVSDYTITLNGSEKDWSCALDAKGDCATGESTGANTDIDRTANWKTYDNAKYAYALKYPADWYELANLEDTDQNQYFSNKQGIGAPLEMGTDGIWLSVETDDNTTNVSLSDWAKTHAESQAQISDVKNT